MPQDRRSVKRRCPWWLLAASALNYAEATRPRRKFPLAESNRPYEARVSTFSVRSSARKFPATSFDKELQVAADNLQRTVEIVRSATGEFSESFHFPSLTQHQFRCLTL